MNEENIGLVSMIGAFLFGCVLYLGIILAGDPISVRFAIAGAGFAYLCQVSVCIRIFTGATGGFIGTALWGLAVICGAVGVFRIAMGY